MYYNRHLNERVYQMPRIFPEARAENLVIQATGVGAKSFSVLISDKLPCLDNIEKGQCFPLYLYDEAAQQSEAADLFTKQGAASTKGLRRRDAITGKGLAHFQEAHPNEQISKEDLFYYVYGLLHSEDYREKYSDNLSKELPRIPRVKTATDFWAFSKAGRALADLHLNYETVDMYPATIVGNPSTDDDYRVEKKKYGAEKDRTTLHYNSKITIKGIPLEAYEYVVNGNPALDWVVERQAVTTHKASGIINDANDWAIETMHNPKYPLELFLREITVSLETMKIVRSLPSLVLLDS